MLFKEWNVLLVDDEPDVLTVTKLALRDMRIYDLPLKIHTAASKAEAIELLNTKLAVSGMPGATVAVALIDVVMETDHAGLDLCKQIRGEMKNWSSQLYIRTGQPGIAPERKVIDEYDISGYISKVDATEQKLYTLIKSGVRQWYSTFYSKLLSEVAYSVSILSESKEQMFSALRLSGAGFESPDLITGIIFDGRDVLSYSPPNVVYAICTELETTPPIIKTPEGHKVFSQGTKSMIHIAETHGTADYVYVLQGKMAMPESLLDLTLRHCLAMSTLWKRAA
jgi:CheY-like chemotaxis protein